QASPAFTHRVEPLPSATATAPASDLPSGEQVSSAFLLLGKSMLGIAGAYLLRALAESSALPRLVTAAVAIVYAIAWLVAASRISARARFAGALYAGTSALILAPMLWELTMRFHVLAPVASAVVLGLFVAAATALNWRRESAPDFAVAYGAAALTALGLSIVTHEMIGFILLLLAMLAIAEYRFMRNGGHGVRMLIAAVSDCAIWILIVVYRTAPDTRADYPALGTAALAGPASLLFLLTTAAVVYWTAGLRRKITAFGTTQAVVAFLLWVLTALFLIPHFSAAMVGVICLLFAGTCYAAAYALFRPTQELHNFYVFSFWAAALLLGGVYLTLPPAWAIASLALASIVSAVLAVRICCITLECHGIIYLGVAAVACGLLEYSFDALAGNMPARVAWSIFLVSGCALLCYAAARERERERWQLQLLHLIPALLAVCAIAALTAHGALRLLALRMNPAAFHVAFIRTLILCAIALALAFAGSRWRRLELKRIAYAALAFVAAKLVFEDLRHGHMGFIAASIFLFALTLIGVPRLARISSRAPVRQI
ncbi:MAG TPA: hypothetical protein VGH84_17625, partial [Steroidobacteraceae bacterium]